MKISLFITCVIFLTATTRDSTAQDGILEIRSYHLKPGTTREFNRLFIEEALPMLHRANINVVTFGPSLEDENSYYLVRKFSDVAERKRQEDDFYGSDEWTKGPREAILSCIENYITMVVPEKSFLNRNTMEDHKADMEKLHALNALFIKNFINQDVTSHNAIIHPDFICIENNGKIVDRATYMKNWGTDYQNSKFLTFTMSDEVIRLFGNTALIRSVTHFTRTSEGKTISGNSVYTDTYVKELGEWRCVQAQITPIAIR